MAEYIPVRIPGQALVAQASAAITGGQLVYVSGSGTVAPATANSPAWLGVAAFDAALGTDVTVHCGGTQEAVASGAITAGALVVAAADGAVSALAAVTTPTAADVTNSRAVVGIALTTAADNIVRVQFIR